MGFWADLFSDNTKEDPPREAPEDRVVERKPMEDRTPDGFPDLQKGTTVDISLQSGKLLLTGRITRFSTSDLTVERLPGCLSFQTRPVGESVFVRGYNRRMVPFSLRATIEESNRVLCKVKNLKVEQIPNHRVSFRLPLHAPASLHRQEDEKYANPESCTLVDISTGGACVESEFIHEEDEILRLKIKLEEYQPMRFLGQIIRAEEHSPGKYRYGILFAQMEDSELTALTRTLYNIQVGQKNEWSRSEVGHW